MLCISAITFRAACSQEQSVCTQVPLPLNAFVWVNVDPILNRLLVVGQHSTQVLSPCAVNTFTLRVAKAVLQTACLVRKPLQDRPPPFARP